MFDPEHEKYLLGKVEDRFDTRFKELRAIFSEEEIEFVKGSAKFYVAFVNLVPLGTFIRKLIGFIGFFVLTWIAFKAGVIEWVKSSL